MNCLLDVNALIAGVYEGHEHHAIMRTWMHEHPGNGWRVAPLVMTGCLRVLLTVSGQKNPAVIIRSILAFGKFYKIETVPDDIDLSKLGKWLTGPKQVTDAHLLAIASRHNLKLLTFDKKIPAKNVVCLPA